MYWVMLIIIKKEYLKKKYKFELIEDNCESLGSEAGRKNLEQWV